MVRERAGSEKRCNKIVWGDKDIVSWNIVEEVPGVVTVLVRYEKGSLQYIVHPRCIDRNGFVSQSRRWENSFMSLVSAHSVNRCETSIGEFYFQPAVINWSYTHGRD